MTEQTFAWRPFLTRWSEEWAGVPDESAAPRPDDEAVRLAGWLGFEPATAERLEAAERRLGRRLPPSYREFLEVTDGWRHAGGFVHLLGGTEGARWHEDSSGFSEYFGEDALEGMWERALQVDVESDLTYVLLDPLDVDEAGEWAVYCHKVWAHSPPSRYGSFREFMVAMYREFHRLAVPRDGGVFENDTTRRLDACVEAARLDALRGEYERAAAALAEAVDFGRPRAVGMLDQLRRLQGTTYTVTYGELPPDPLYAPEVVPVLALEHQPYQGATVWGYRVRPASEQARAEADELLRQVTERTFRYAAAGPFGAAVDRAREQARWGGTDAAWDTLLTALPRWEPLGPDHLAPVGLLADSLLGPMITPERGRELLATPRAAGVPAGERAESVEPSAERHDEDGLAWLVDPRPGGGRRASYRFVLVEGAAPDELPARLGAEGGEGAALNALMGSQEAWHHRHGGGVSSTYDDRALAAVGWAGGSGWSFAFDADPASYDSVRFESPAAAASRGGGRAVVVWSEPERGVFHLSVAEGGEERYAFTVRGPDDVRTGGAIPPALDPASLFVPPGHGARQSSEPRHDSGPRHDSEPRRPPEPRDASGLPGDAGRPGERRALAAVAAEFGVSLPRFALTEGRLHTFTTRSWTRPPGPGETYAVVTVALPEVR
ncbi:SMI1/KNR4 family protein [Kitasatospora sp. NPDC091207]|uniref:SMI1/KNR4 family protein n=1 Tax=Kitasatospora sp. NPDC091207 TaxID=3364083 RepID=UPI0037F7B1FC